MVRLDPEEHPVLEKYVFVRVTDMKGVDLNRFDFDCDLTFCSLIVHPQGRILHTYGGREESDPESHLSVPSLLRVMEKAAIEVDADAARLKMAKGDRLLRLNSQLILTYGDVCRVLHDTSAGGGTIEVTWLRGEEEKSGELRLKDGWRTPTPEQFAWRPSKWPLSPKPGFGGPQLSKADLKRKGLPEDSFAFRVGYIVTWGANGHTGRNAARAGIRKGDVVIRVGGKNDFESGDHFHAWFRLTRRVGETVPIEVLRGGKRKLIKLKTVE